MANPREMCKNLCFYIFVLLIELWKMWKIDGGELFPF